LIAKNKQYFSSEFEGSLFLVMSHGRRWYTTNSSRCLKMIFLFLVEDYLVSELRDSTSLTTSVDSISSGLANNYIFVVGNENLSRFWSDVWFSRFPLKVIYSRLYILSTKLNATIADMRN
jgi:hypothetical protein